MGLPSYHGGIFAAAVGPSAAAVADSPQLVLLLTLVARGSPLCRVRVRLLSFQGPQVRKSQDSRKPCLHSVIRLACLMRSHGRIAGLYKELRQPQRFLEEVQDELVGAVDKQGGNKDANQMGSQLHPASFWGDFWEPLRSTSSCAPAPTIPVGVAPLAFWWAGS